MLSFQIQERVVSRKPKFGLREAQKASAVISRRLEGDDHYRCQSRRDNMKHELDRELSRSLFFHEAEQDLFEPQMGLAQSLLKRLNPISASWSQFSTDELAKHAERFAALCVCLESTSNLRGAIASFYQYACTYTDSSVALQICEYLQHKSGFTPQSGVEGSNDTTTVDDSWISFLRGVRSDWKMIRNNKFFEHLSRVLGLFVAMNFCEASSTTFSIGKYTIIEPTLLDKHKKSTDFGDAVFDSLIFFVERGSLAWENQTLAPFLLDDTKLVDFDNRFNKLVLWSRSIPSGNLKKVHGIEDHEFDCELNTLMKDLEHLLKTLAGNDKVIMQRHYFALARIKDDFITSKISTAMRPAPLVVLYYGASDQVKTTLCTQNSHSMLAAKGYKTSQEYQGAINPGDKYLSTWKTRMNCMLIDDMCNDAPDFVNESPAKILRDVANNAPFCANMADLESKGKVFVEPRLVNITTNVKDLDAHLYSRCPASIQRRVHYTCTVRLKDEFVSRSADGIPLGSDAAALKRSSEAMPDWRVFDDFWVLDIEQTVPPPSDRPNAKARYTAVLRPDGSEMRGVTSDEARNFLVDQFVLHSDRQDSYIQNLKARQKRATLCGVDGCYQTYGHCLKHPVSICQPVRNENGEDLEVIVSEDENLPIWDRLQIFNTVTGEEVRGDDDINDSEREIFEDDFHDPPDLEYEPHSGIIDKICLGYMDYQKKSFLKYINLLQSDVQTMALLGLVSCTRRFMHHWDWVTLLPTPWLENQYIRTLCLVFGRRTIARNYIQNSLRLWIILLMLFSFVFYYSTPLISLCVGLFYLTIGFCFQKTMADNVKEQYLDALVARNTSMQNWFSTRRSEHVAKLLALGGVIAAGYTAATLYKKTKHNFDPQGSLEPSSQSDVDKRDSEESPWHVPSQLPLPRHPDNHGSTPEQFLKLVEKNLVYGTMFKSKDGKEELWEVNGLFLKSNVVIIPAHYIDQDTIVTHFCKANPQNGGGKMKGLISRARSVRIKGTDLCLCYFTVGASFNDISRFLPASRLGFVEFNFLHRKKNGEMERNIGQGYYGPCGHSLCSYPGIAYSKLDRNTRKGLCGSVLISPTTPMILGYHLAGKEGTWRGNAGFITHSMFVESESKLYALEGVLNMADAGTMEPQSMGKTFMTNDDVHKKSPVNWMPRGTQVEVYGTCIGRSTFKTSTKPSLITEHVMDVCDVPNIYRGPTESPQWKPYQDCLQNVSHPGSEFDPVDLHWAIRDYKDPLITVFSSDLWNNARPLTDVENWNGQIGVKFIDRVNSHSSIGFPLTGAKTNYLIEVEPFDGYDKVVEATPLLQAEIDRMIKCYENGVRAYPVAKACKKDEVHSKEKCRIFYSNPTAFTFLVRKYFLPLLRVMQFNPKISECAVGINSHGPEWQELHDHIYHFGEDRLIGGDYSKYDQKLPSQLLIAALRILIDCARVCHYTDHDIHMMESMCSDLVYAMIAFDGNIIGLTHGTHISGNSLTVVLNGICGSLNLRCYYRQGLKERGINVPFREFVKLMTYGDDNVGSVSHNCDFFTIKGASAYLAKHGQQYTMPDKESELRDFLPPEDFEFVKRKSVYHPKLDCMVGALSDDSIFKMLHYYLRPKNSPITDELACAQNIDTALREWFNHGEEIYEWRRSQMIEIAKRSNLINRCVELDYTYDRRVLMWKHKYEDPS